MRRMPDQGGPAPAAIRCWPRLCYDSPQSRGCGEKCHKTDPMLFAGAGRRAAMVCQWFCRSASDTGVLATRLAGKMAADTVATMPTAKAMASTEGTTRIVAV